MPKKSSKRACKALTAAWLIRRCALLTIAFMSLGCIRFDFERRDDGTYWCKLPRGGYTLHATRKRSDSPVDITSVSQWKPTNNHWFSEPSIFWISQFEDRRCTRPVSPPKRSEIVKLCNNNRYHWKIGSFSVEKSAFVVISFENKGESPHSGLQQFLLGRRVQALKFVK